MGDDSLFTRSACSALVITCADFRFKSVEQAFIESAGLVDDYDLIARPGAVRSLVSPRDEAARASMEAEVRLLHALHRFTRVLMLNHVSCRAYDDLVAGADERALHVAQLATAREAIARCCEGATAEPYLITISGGEARVEKIAVA